MVFKRKMPIIRDRLLYFDVNSPWLYRPFSSYLHGPLLVKHPDGTWMLQYDRICNDFPLVQSTFFFNDAIESDAILKAAWVCLEQKILLPWQREIGALELYRVQNIWFSCKGCICCSSIFTLKQFVFVPVHNILNWYKIFFPSAIFNFIV